MSKTAPHLHQLQLASKDCAQVFLQQKPASLEKLIEAVVAANESFTLQAPHYALLLLNSSDKALSFLENLIIKQLLTVSLFSAKLNVLPKTVKTLNRVSLYILYWLSPALIGLKQNKISAEKFVQLKQQAINKAFKLAYHVKIADKDAIKILSQIAQTNVFHNTNQQLQCLVLFAINTNLSANVKLNNRALCLEHAINENLLLPQTALTLSNRFLPNFIDQFQSLTSPAWFAGNLIASAHLGYFLVIGQTPDLEAWYGLPFEPEKKRLLPDVTKVASYQITQFYPQYRLDHDELWRTFDLVKTDWPIEQAHFVSQGYYDPKKLKYSVPEFWPKATQALLNGNINELAKAVDSRSEFRAILLDYASQINRNKLTVHRSRHAISLLGLDRVFPIIAIGMMKLVEESFCFPGSHELNNKVDFMAKTAASIAKDKAQYSLPEYHSLIARLLALSLFTIPKVAFNATSHSPKKISPIAPLTSAANLAELYQYPKIELWYKVIMHMIEIWQLPSVIKQFMRKYFTLVSGGKVHDLSALETEWLTVLEHNNLLYLFCHQHVLSSKMEKKVKVQAQRVGLSISQLKRQAMTAMREQNRLSVLT